jgi:predicted porin
MKKNSMLLAAATVATAAGLGSPGAMAQTNVTVYGIVDTSIHYVSSDSATGQSNIRMDNGAIANSRWGVKGSEDLGDGLSAVFRLEGGFNGDSGSQSDSTSLFNRATYVGLNSSTFGQLTMGRQQTPFFDLMVEHFDPLTVGNYDLNEWLPAGATRIRNSNMLKYFGTFGNLSAGVSYALGEQAGASRQGSQVSSTLRYAAGALEFGGAYQNTVSAVNANWKDTSYNLSVTYDLSVAKLFAGYYRITDSTGMTPVYFAAAHSQASVDGGGIGGIERTDNGYFLGVRYKATPKWTLTGAAYYDRSSNVSINTLGNLGDGSRYDLVALAEYALSKTTTVYGTIDYNKASKAQIVELAGKSSVTDVAFGIRHVF